MEKRIIALIAILLLISQPVLAIERQVPLEGSGQSDVPTYDFLSGILKLSESVTNSVLDESNTSVGKLECLGLVINTTSMEVSLYEQKGVKTRLTTYFPSFVGLYLALTDVVDGQILFLENFPGAREGNISSYYLALTGVQKGLVGVKKARVSLKRISEFKFVTPQGNITLDTSKLSKDLDRIERLFLGYNALLKNYQPKEKPLVIYTSNTAPPIGSNVTIYGFTKGINLVTLQLTAPRGSEEVTSVPVKKGEFRVVYTLNETGIYTVFAVGYLNGTVIKSNTLKINVTKIPTFIISQNGTAYIGQPYEVTAVLQDYIGRPIPNQTIRISGKPIESLIMTDSEGSIHLNITSQREGVVKLTLSYRGSTMYAASNTTLTVNFLRYPLRITLIGPEKTRAGKNFTVRVNLTANYPVPINILVDNRTYLTVNSSRPFNVSLSLEKGRHTIKAIFKGDSFYAPSKSSVLTIEAIAGPPYIEILLTSIVLIGAVALYYYTTQERKKPKRNEGITEEEFLELLKRAEAERKKKKGKHLNDYYKQIYLKLLDVYHLGRSTTPRELLYHVKSIGESFSEHLASATDYHERYTYARRKLTAEEIIDFIKSIANTIVEIFVRDEL